jgi:1-deoxy-D-xylulose-5-phosphate reductoisomerase
VDSEHSAIFQCLAGEHFNPVEKLIITASGGAFRGFTPKQLEQVTLKDALKHPNWSMGPKVTIDSASLMNKGLEVIEAKWLFGMPLEKIDVLVHPQSVIHSMVQFEDGSVKAQLGIPDMRLPIQYALSYPVRLPLPYPRLDFNKYSNLTFEQPNKEVFPCLAMAYKASAAGGGMPCVMNAANEVAVKQFMEGKIRFVDIPHIIEQALATAPTVKPKTIEDYIALDAETRKRI